MILPHGTYICTYLCTNFNTVTVSLTISLYTVYCMFIAKEANLVRMTLKNKNCYRQNINAY